MSYTEYLEKMTARYRVILSETRERADQLEDLLRRYPLGTKVHMIKDGELIGREIGNIFLGRCIRDATGMILRYEDTGDGWLPVVGNFSHGTNGSYPITPDVFEVTGTVPVR